MSMVFASVLFSLNLRFAPDYIATYGSLGAVIALRLWLYLMGAVILIGGEVCRDRPCHGSTHSSKSGVRAPVLGAPPQATSVAFLDLVLDLTDVVIFPLPVL